MAGSCAYSHEHFGFITDRHFLNYQGEYSLQTPSMVSGLTAETQVQHQPSPCVTCGDKVVLGQVFL